MGYKKQPQRPAAGIPASSDALAYLHLIHQNRGKLLLTLLVVLALSVIYLISTERVYETSALLRLEGEESFLQTLLGKGVKPYSEAPLAKEESQMLRSRAVLGSVVDELNLTIVTRPVLLPVIGRIASAVPAARELFMAHLPSNGYAWGGETLTVASLDLPRKMLGKRMILTAGEPGYFSLRMDDSVLVEKAEVGSSIPLQFDDSSSHLIRVSHLEAPLGTRFEVYRLSRATVIDALREALSINARDARTRVIELVLEGTDPEGISRTLNETVATYQRLRLNWSSGEASQELRFLETRLPVAKAELEQAENALAEFRSRHSSVDISAEVKERVKKAVDLEAQLERLLEERSLLAEQYTPEYPEIAKLDSRVAMLRVTLAKTRRKLEALPDIKKQLMSMSREVETRSVLYTSLQERAQKLRIAEASSVGSLRLIDTAVPPEKPVWPRPKIVVPLAVLAALFAHLVVIFVRAAFSNRIRDAESIERMAGLPVYLDIPCSARQTRLTRPARTWFSRQDKRDVLALRYPDDQAVETLRSLRIMLSGIMADADNSILMICGPLPQMGKSFVSANLAALLAETGKKVLLIDADFRRGNLHGLFGMENELGLKDVLFSRVCPDEAVKHTALDGLDLITKGRGESPNDLLLESGMSRIAQGLSQAYDYILVDAPPVLSLSAAAIIGRVAGASIMVLRTEVVTADEMQAALKRLRLAGASINGCLINNTRPGTYRYAYRYGYGER